MLPAQSDIEVAFWPEQNGSDIASNFVHSMLKCHYFPLPGLAHATVMLRYFDQLERRPSARRHLASLWLCLVTLIFVLQIAGAGWHKHDLSDLAPDCVSCQIASHFPSKEPAVNTALHAVFLVVVYQLARLPQYVFLAAPSYLIPQRQAPPYLAT